MGTLTGQFQAPSIVISLPLGANHFCRSHRSPPISTAKYKLIHVIVLQPRQMVTGARSIDGIDK